MKPPEREKINKCFENVLLNEQATLTSKLRFFFWIVFFSKRDFLAILLKWFFFFLKYLKCCWKPTVGLPRVRGWFLKSGLVVGSRPRGCGFESRCMDVSNACYYKWRRERIKVAKWGTTKKYLKNKVDSLYLKKDWKSPLAQPWME
jgi:hypothetical protein